MQKKTSPLLWLLPLVVVLGAGLLFTAKNDLLINQALYNPGNPFAVFMECFGWYPAFGWGLFLTMLVATQREGRLSFLPLRVLALAVMLGGTLYMYYNSYKDMLKRGWVSGPYDMRNLVALVIVLALVALCLVLTGGVQPGAVRSRLWFAACCGSIYLAMNQAVIYAMKAIWARTRFDEMLATGLTEFESFTHWYLPGGNGGSSFPSGHTANAAGILVLVVLCDVFPAWHKRRRLVYALCWVYVALMGFARVIIGRHYLSDTLGAAAVMALLLFILRHNPWYRRAIQKATSREVGKEPARAG